MVWLRTPTGPMQGHWAEKTFAREEKKRPVVDVCTRMNTRGERRQGGGGYAPRLSFIAAATMTMSHSSLPRVLWSRSSLRRPQCRNMLVDGGAEL